MHPKTLAAVTVFVHFASMPPSADSFSSFDTSEFSPTLQRHESIENIGATTDHLGASLPPFPTSPASDARNADPLSVPRVHEL